MKSAEVDLRPRRGLRPGETLQRPLVLAVLTWIVGSVVARELAALLPWVLQSFVTLAVLSLATVIVMHARGRSRAVTRWLLVAIFFMAGAWLLTDQTRLRSDSIQQYLTEASQLARVRGVVDAQVTIASPQTGDFAPFTHELPATFTLLQLDHLLINDTWEPVSGRLLLRIDQIDSSLQTGDHIEATGWLGSFDTPGNPGERNFRATMAQRHIDGRLTLRQRGNWRLLEPAAQCYSPWTALQHLRQHIGNEAGESLRLGMEQQPQALALLNLLLLGRHSGGHDLHERFRDVGLAHILAISGAHLAILLGLVWLVARLVTARPPRAALIVLAVLLLYLLTVPLKPPIVRAAIMAGVFFLGFMSGRRVRGVDMLAVAALLVLLLNPADLFTAGFQLSFTVVAAMILFATQFTEIVWPPESPQIRPSWQWRAGRWLWGYAAVSVVAFLAATPLVAFHFQMITPFAVLLSVLALPLVILLLGLGYLKILAGLAWPSISLLLAEPLGWAADAMIGLVDHANHWPGATVLLPRSPGVLWTAAALGVLFAVGMGMFARRRLALGAAVGVLVVWSGLLFFAPPSVMLTPKMKDVEDVLKLRAISVGNGACYVVTTRRFTLMFDCGSHEYLDIGDASVVPALRALGIHRIDLLLLSHPDMDHFSGVLDLADALPIGQILITPQFLAEAEANPQGPAMFLLEGLAEHGQFPQTADAGWEMMRDDVQFELLWPPSDFHADRDNDTSFVLRMEAAGRVLLLNGDIQQQAMTRLFGASAPLRADVTDLPHHGSFTDTSVPWLDTVKPQVVIQSAHWNRLHVDPWAPVFAQRPDIVRLVTARDGMVQIAVDADGGLRFGTFRNTTNHSKK